MFRVEAVLHQVVLIVAAITLISGECLCNMMYSIAMIVIIPSTVNWIELYAIYT